MKRKLTAMGLAIAMILGIFAGVNPQTAFAAGEETLTVDYAKNMSELDAAVGATGGYSETVAFPWAEGDDTVKITKTVKLEIPYDSLVCLDASLKEDGRGMSWGHLKVYSNAALSNKILDESVSCGKATPNSEREILFLKKGIYYAVMELQRNDSFEEDMNMTAALYATAIKKSDAFKVTAKEKKAGKYEISFTNNLGNIIKGLYYIKGGFSEDDKYGSGLIKLDADQKSVTVNATGKYSVVICLEGNVSWDISDEKHNYEVYTINVKSDDKTKPTVSGVKNGKTYNKAVTIKFSDKGSGIKSAKLNGKKIKSGTKVSANGSYTLVVIDNAGNKTIVKFKIKK